MAGNPRVYGNLVSLLGKYSKFADAGDKAGVRQALAEDGAPADAASDEATDPQA
ncbi:hypothetical protein D3C72_2491280 [compost metagenome]